MIVSVVLLGSIKTLLRPSRCRHCLAMVRQWARVRRRCDLDLAAKKITTGAIGALGRTNIPDYWKSVLDWTPRMTS
jgi:hypothetical protein